MARRRKSILLVPPKGARIRVFRIRVLTIVSLLLFFALGIGGLFIPFNNFTLDVVEQNQKKNLSEQNKELLVKIHDMRKLLHSLTSRIGGLEKRKERIVDLVGTRQSREVREDEVVDLSGLSLDELLAYSTSAELVYRSLASKLESNPAYLRSIPVLRPIEKNAAVSAIFGEMRDPFTGNMKWHQGMDFVAERETPVIATADGTVVAVGKYKRWGRKIRISHGFGFSTVYAHLGTVKVAKGRKVKRGDVIATVGISGMTTGPHLHYEILRKGKALDPADYIFPENGSLAMVAKN